MVEAVLDALEDKPHQGAEVHQSRDRETEKQLLSQGHQTNIEWLLPTH